MWAISDKIVAMVELRPFRADDSYLIKSEDHHPGARIAMSLEQRGPAYSAWDGNRCVAAAGVAILWKGVGEGWAFLDHEWMRKHPLLLTKTVKNVMNEIRVGMNLHRLQVFVPIGDAAHEDWPRLLGLKIEATVKQYYPDRRNAYLYSWVK